MLHFFAGSGTVSPDSSTSKTTVRLQLQMLWPTSAIWKSGVRISLCAWLATKPRHNSNFAFERYALIIFYLVVLLSAVPKHPWFGEEVAGFTIAKYLGILCLVYTLLALVLRTTVPGFFSNW